MNKKSILVLSVLVLMVVGSFLLFGNKKEEVVSNNKIKVVTTLFPLYDLAKEIGGDKVEVSLLLPPGMGPHSFEPKPSDIIKINESDLFIYTGKFMEPWAEDIIKGITNENVKIVNASTGIKLMEIVDEHGHEEEHENEGIDPHIWLDFDNSQIMVDSITKALIEKDFINTDLYQNNAIIYKNKLTQLDDKFKSNLTSCESREIVYGGHYAFGYMGKKYDLTYESAYGISPDSEPSAADLIKLIEQIKKEKIKFVFAEELLSQEVAETLAKETGAGILLLNPAGNLSKEDFENNKDFLSIMEENLSNLKLGLGCGQ